MKVLSYISMRAMKAFTRVRLRVRRKAQSKYKARDLIVVDNINI